VPLQHLLGSVGFRQLEFKCDARALIPRPETEELAELVATRLPPPEGAAILDMGCGSGVLGLTLAHEFPTTRVTLVDLSAGALDLARENAAAIGAPASAGQVEFIESDLFAALPAEADFDLIVANLPYVAERDRDELAPEVRHDPPLALFGGEDGLEVLRRFLPGAARRGWCRREPSPCPEPEPRDPFPSRPAASPARRGRSREGVESGRRFVPKSAGRLP